MPTLKSLKLVGSSFTSSWPSLRLLFTRRNQKMVVSLIFFFLGRTGWIKRPYKGSPFRPQWVNKLASQISILVLEFFIIGWNWIKLRQCVWIVFGGSENVIGRRFQAKVKLNSDTKNDLSPHKITYTQGQNASKLKLRWKHKVAFRWI